MKSELLKKAKSWHQKADEENDYFIKFMCDYLAFIAILNSEYRTNGRGDRNPIQNLKQDRSKNNKKIKSKYFEELDKDCVQKIIKELNTNPITNETKRNDVWWDCDNNNPLKTPSSNDGKILSIEDFKNMVEFIYRARNNLFHGKKGIDFGRDALIMKYGCSLINPLVTVLISEMI